MPTTDASASEQGAGAPDEGADGAASDEGADGAAPEPVTLTRSDERILAYLDDVGADYQAFVSGNTGLYAAHVGKRLDALAAAELVEQVTGESVYRVTDAGRDALREDCPSWSD